jgi:hypothetical protein
LQIFVPLDLAARIALSEDIELGGMLSAKGPSAMAPRTSHEPGSARDYDDNNDNRLDHDWRPNHDRSLRRNSACLRRVPRLSHQNNATAITGPSGPRRGFASDRMILRLGSKAIAGADRKAQQK